MLLNQDFCRTACVIKVEGVAQPLVRNCKLKCKRATTSFVEVEYNFEIKKGASVTAVVEVYKGGRLVGRGMWRETTPAWCWANPLANYCWLTLWGNVVRRVNISGVLPGDVLKVVLRVTR